MLNLEEITRKYLGLTYFFTVEQDGVTYLEILYKPEEFAAPQLLAIFSQRFGESDVKMEIYSQEIRKLLPRQYEELVRDLKSLIDT